jgi:hypothetical protein
VTTQLRVVYAGDATPTEGASQMGQSRSLSMTHPLDYWRRCVHRPPTRTPASLARIPRRPEMIIDCGTVSKKTRGIILTLFAEAGAFPLFLF